MHTALATLAPFSVHSLKMFPFFSFFLILPWSYAHTHTNPPSARTCVQDHSRSGAETSHPPGLSWGEVFVCSCQGSFISRITGAAPNCLAAADHCTCTQNQQPNQLNRVQNALFCPRKGLERKVAWGFGGFPFVFCSASPHPRPGIRGCSNFECISLVELNLK